LSVASRECELLVAEALSQDLLENDHSGNEVQIMDEIINETVEPVEEVIAEIVEETPVVEEVEETVEVVAEEPQEIVQADPAVSELDVAKAQIESLKAEIDEKNSALVEATKQINELSAQIEALTPYKEAAEKAELEAAEAKRNAEIEELRQYAESSGVLSKEELESEEVAALINDLKTLEIKALIADRIVEKSKNAKPIETSQKRTPKVRTEINYSEDTTNPVDALRNFIRRG
jgi:chromosome segregation ATPase